MTLYTVHPSPLGELLIAGPEPGVLSSVHVPGQRYATGIGADWRRDDGAFTAATRQFDAYFGGELKEFDLRCAVSASGFRTRVWEALDRIPFGTTVTYGGLAVLAGVPAAAVRAVGGAVGRNPLTVVRPCHRVIGANGSLTGYAGGMERKRLLLTLEGVLG
ncbi:methylated-DNA--[protein]-cysteine S-methyltransferase [Streptomyces sp. ACA25]|uniref:methylated-DNA--[protein]-cysteine S-methyltransferase n=1 Tax=Streptomyces sp. ACA25 TaxID=3022596 RepID=UPI00230785CE|nr:methylated-DNA--[protein]-cysteine S-methyltransferase [Streptomyces sp. ACA25]MDB1089202.1 methylated-DNA--[protein]-cysteine S-methyltransferase [Streptomyces sp. ACA25]